MPLELHRYEVPDSRADRSARESAARLLDGVHVGLWVVLVVLLAKSCS